MIISSENVVVFKKVLGKSIDSQGNELFNILTAKK